MRRNVRRHADRDPGRSIDEQVRYATRKDHGLAFAGVVRVLHIDGLAAEIRQDFFGDRRQSALGIAHRGCVVAIDRSVVATDVDHRDAERKRLSHSDERIVDGGVTVRVVFPHDRTHDLRALAWLRGMRDPLLVHRIEDAALDWLEPIANVG